MYAQFIPGRLVAEDVFLQLCNHEIERRDNISVVRPYSLHILPPTEFSSLDNPVNVLKG